MLYLSSSSKTPLYQQIYEYIKTQIITGELEEGDRLISLREYSKMHCVSRNTVENAYAQLCAEGYVENRPGSGYYISNVKEYRLLLSNTSIEDKDANNYYNKLPKENSSCKYDFQYFNLDSDIFPSSILGQNVRKVLNSDNLNEINEYNDIQGDYLLRKEITKYLMFERCIHCLPDQIIITSGTQRSLDIVCQLIYKKDRIMAMEDPGYDVARNIMFNNSFKIIPISIENDGINLKELINSQAKITYVTPSHQFPTGTIMSMKKRLKLLKWAKTNKTYIIEDDYDSEFMYNQKPIPSLYSLDSENQVIYLGTFSRLFSTGLRMSYIILPFALMNHYNRIFKGYYCNVSWFLQKVIYEFMKDKNWGNYLRRIHTESFKKRNILVKSINKYFRDRVIIHGKQSGMHIILEFKDDIKAKDIINYALKNNVRVYPIHKYWFDKSKYKSNQILVGYAGMSEVNIHDGIQLLAQAWKNLL